MSELFDVLGYYYTVRIDYCFFVTLYSEYDNVYSYIHLLDRSIS